MPASYDDFFDEYLEENNIPISHSNAYDEYLDYECQQQDNEDQLKDKCKSISTYMIDNKCTLRICSENLCIPVTTIHRYIYKYISNWYPNDYREIVKLLRWNKKYRNGPRRYWRYKPDSNYN